MLPPAESTAALRPRSPLWAWNLALLLVWALASAACRTQRWPGPMRPTVLPLAGGEDPANPPGPEEVIAVRHSAPVSVRQWGSPSGYPLDRSNSRERVRAGGWVLCGAGGRAEVLWPLEQASVELMGTGVASIGARSRDEPALRLLQVTMARAYLMPGMRIALPGGATLAGDPSAPSGPFALEFVEPNLVRVDNQSKVSAFVAFRDTVLVLGPGQVADLGLLQMGSAPVETPSELRSLDYSSPSGTQISGWAEGGARAEESPAGIRVSAVGRGSVEVLGVRVAMDAGRRAEFRPLDELPAAGAP